MSDTATDRVGRGAVWNLAYIGFVRLASFGLSVVVARVLGAAGAGAGGVALQVSSLLSVASGLGLYPAVIRNVAAARDGREAWNTLVVSFRLVAFVSLGVAVVWTLSAPTIARLAFREASLAPALAWCGPLALATALMVWSESAFQGRREFRALALWGGSLAAVDFVLGAIASFWNLEAVLVARALVRIGAAAVAISMCLRWFREARRATPDAAGTSASRAEIRRSLLGLAAPAFLAGAAALFGQFLLRALLVRSAGLVEAGQWTAADTIGQGLLLVPAAAGAAYAPIVARAAHDPGGVPISTTLTRGLRRVAGFNLPLCLLVAGGALWIVPLIFGHGFDGAIPVVVWMVVSNALAGSCIVLAAAFQGRGQLWPSFWFQILWLAIAISAYVLGGDRGALPLAVAFTVAYVVNLAAHLTLGAQRFGLAVGPLVPVLLAHGLLLAAALAFTGRWIDPRLAAAGSLAAAVVVFRAWGWPALKHEGLMRGWTG
jgi:O-antigen/teichoic acid export membrane protein